jgi:hypothetical protein
VQKGLYYGYCESAAFFLFFCFVNNINIGFSFMQLRKDQKWFFDHRYIFGGGFFFFKSFLLYNFHDTLFLSNL